MPSSSAATLGTCVMFVLKVLQSSCSTTICQIIVLLQRLDSASQLLFLTSRDVRASSIESCQAESWRAPVTEACKGE